MNLNLQPLKKEEIDLFNREDERAFNVHARYFPNGPIPGAADDDRDEYELCKIIDDPIFTILSIKDGEKFIGGAIIKDMGKGVREIGIFFLIVEYQSKGIGKTALDMVEAYFPDTEIFHLITPSQVIRNTVFYINKCGYHIVKVMEFNPTSNTADYVFEKKKQILEVKRNDT